MFNLKLDTAWEEEVAGFLLIASAQGPRVTTVGQMKITKISSLVRLSCTETFEMKLKESAAHLIKNQI